MIVRSMGDIVSMAAVRDLPEEESWLMSGTNVEADRAINKSRAILEGNMEAF
jgi:hypothetical protein